MESVRDFYFDGPTSNCFGYAFANTCHYINSNSSRFVHANPDFRSDCFGVANAHPSAHFDPDIGSHCFGCTYANLTSHLNTDAACYGYAYASCDHTTD